MDEGMMKSVSELLGWLGPPVMAAVAWLARRVAVLEARVVKLDEARDKAVAAHAECRSELATLKATMARLAPAAVALVLALGLGGCGASSPAPGKDALCRGAEVGCRVACDSLVPRICGGVSGGESFEEYSGQEAAVSEEDRSEADDATAGVSRPSGRLGMGTVGARAPGGERGLRHSQQAEQARMVRRREPFGQTLRHSHATLPRLERGPCGHDLRPRRGRGGGHSLGEERCLSAASPAHQEASPAG